MRKSEQKLWDCFKRNMPAHLWLQRVENVVGDGIPDVYVGSSGLWVELKAPARMPVRANTPLLGSGGIRPSQINWHVRTASTRAAVRSYVLIRTAEGELLLIPGQQAGVINLSTLDELRALSVTKFNPCWGEIMEKLA